MNVNVYHLSEIDYNKAWNLQKSMIKQVDEGAPDHLLLLEHPPTYTMGRGTKQDNLLIGDDELKKRHITLVEIDRGGDITYHGPGQCVGYPILHLGLKGSPRRYVNDIEEVLIATLAHWGITGSKKEAYHGVWVEDEKIAAIGVKFSRGRKRPGYITSHGFAFNVNTDLTYFDSIIPCGIREFGVTSLKKIVGKEIPMKEFYDVVTSNFADHFGFSTHLLDQYSLFDNISQLQSNEIVMK